MNDLDALNSAFLGQLGPCGTVGGLRNTFQLDIGVQNNQH